jgi:PiT family inorganic phosphate transporter
MLTTLLILALLAVCIFEFVNGFHDTANAVATVIYTKSLKPKQAVVWSGIMNFLGLITGGVGVALSIVTLIPKELLTDTNIYHSMGMVMSILITAIFWNLATWYKGIPASSSHTLIGSIIGVSVGYSIITGIDYTNWGKIIDIGKALFFSPVLGFTMVILLMWFLNKVIKRKDVFEEPKDTPPPFWIRATLISTCTLVSFFHGRNDGQKGVGLAMIILMAFLPLTFTLENVENPPMWVMWMIATSLGLGTMIGWKRIVVTIGEKIGKQHLTYAQGASSELVAAITIGLSTAFKLPVSTTHILSSGIAGSMVASKGVNNLKTKTIKTILSAWILTLPVTIGVSCVLFLLFRYISG